MRTHAGAVAFISVVVKTDLLLLYLVTTRQKKNSGFLLQDEEIYMRVNLLQNKKITLRDKMRKHFTVGKIGHLFRS